METRELGRTGLRVTPVGLGLAALGRPAYITAGRDRDLGDGRDRSVEAMEARSHDALDAAWAAGIRYLDAARSYGYAERFLASWLRARAIDPSEVTVGSKWGYRYVGEWRMDAPVHETKDHSLANLRAQWPESRELLGPWLRLYQVHSATLESGILTDEAVLAELARLRAEEGIVVGLSVSGPRQADVIRAALGVRVDGVNPFAQVQATWNLLEPSAGPALAEAHDAGWGVIVKEALANGRLLEGGGDEAVARGHARTGHGRDVLAMAAVLANPWADVVLSGAVTPDQVRSNVGAAAVTDRDDLAGILSTRAEDPEAYWAARSARAWA
ncbi:MAG TPA: aldo/keto reductase [Candidatus Limnocylindrales bacterium]|nr:aldo/keto reductase [Candidatus Limnocylindrales bacterium]